MSHVVSVFVSSRKDMPKQPNMHKSHEACIGHQVGAEKLQHNQYTASDPSTRPCLPGPKAIMRESERDHDFLVAVNLQPPGLALDSTSAPEEEDDGDGDRDDDDEENQVVPWSAPPVSSSSLSSSEECFSECLCVLGEKRELRKAKSIKLLRLLLRLLQVNLR
ncbi:B-box type zinc finger family protein [Prunus dulcis]|uniref:B-box type zinc finger family protein n=1 Tax=Prunus dulcis TaxID=3755 RepID=A0A4Y1R4H7_PRUDU|nr:B-box type zinc finger family protein [Prunus dulcis]